jgi:DNA-binding beta-propeller fold protein YncE
MRHRARRYSACLCAAACAVTTGAAPAAAVTDGAHYRLAQQVPLPGDEGWDYLAFAPESHRLFISHGTRVLVVDAARLRVVGEVGDTPGVHGIALAPDLGRGFISAGRAGTIVVFDLKTLARLQEIRASGENPDAILYHRGARIALDARPEFAASDGAGPVYVNLEDKNSIAVIDPRDLKVMSVWPLTGCEGPSGLALDHFARRLFAVCGNKVMTVVDAVSGRVLGSAPIGAGVDAAVFDPAARLAFASCGEGVLTAVRVNPDGAPEVAQSVPTQRGARTMALDPRTHRIFLVTADFGPPPAPTAEQPHPRPPLLPGSFRLLVVAPGNTAR